MAVDSRHKRFAFLGFGDGSHLHSSFEADGSVDADDRLHLLDLYSGIAADSPSAAPTGVFSILDITEAFRNIFRGEHTFTTEARTRAIEELRDVIGDRIYSGRAPQGVELPWLDIMLTGVDRSFNLTEESSCCRSFIQCTVWAKYRADAYRAANAIRQAVGAMQGTVVTSLGDIEIGAVSIESDSQGAAVGADDGSDDYMYPFDLTLFVSHSQNVASGQS